MLYQIKSQQENLEEINLRQGQALPQLDFVNKSLPAEKKEKVMEMLRKYSDVFAWGCNEMPCLDPSLVVHHLDVFLNSKPLKQVACKYHSDLDEKIKEEIENLRVYGFI